MAGATLAPAGDFASSSHQEPMFLGAPATPSHRPRFEVLGTTPRGARLLLDVHDGRTA